MTIASALAAVQERIADACRHAGRDPRSVRLVAASKAQPVAAILAAAQAGQRIFGENYAREMREKRLETGDSVRDLEWHFIGRVQASNSKEIATATLVHGIGAIDQAEALAKRAKGAPVNGLLQLSLWNEESKNGFSYQEIERDLHVLQKIEGLAIRGFMAMPPPNADARAAFAAVRKARDTLAPDLSELSMGMSDDYFEAVLEGATLVRVGSAIFGPRPVRGNP